MFDRRSLTCGLAVMCLLTGVNVPAQDYEVTVSRVSVWVKATDKSGKDVPRLTQNDFELYEDGKRMDITCFEEVNLATNNADVAVTEDETADASGKHVVFLVDLQNTSQTEWLHLQDSVASFVNNFEAGWAASLISIPGAGMIETHVEKTSSADSITGAMERLRANSLRDQDQLDKRRRILNRLEHDSRAFTQKAAHPNPAAAACEMAHEFAQQEKQEALLWIRSLRELDDLLAGQDAEHTVVILLSGGLNSEPGKQYFDLIRQKIGHDQRDVATDLFCSPEGSSHLRKRLNEAVGALNRRNVTFYTINTRGPINDLIETVRESGRRLKSSDFDFLDEQQAFMAEMATKTGGTYFENSLNFRRGFDAIVGDLNHQYLLCYAPPQHDEEGDHKIEVKTKRPGVRLRHRSGYYSE